MTESLAYNSVKNMWIVDGAITSERLLDSRNPQEFIGYAIKEAFSLCFLYYAGGKIQKFLENNTTGILLWMPEYLKTTTSNKFLKTAQ